MDFLNCVQVEDYWGNFCSSQKIYNSIDNCWDLCIKFDEGTAGKMYEYDSNDSDNDIYHPKILRRSPTPKNGRSGDGSTYPPIVVDSESTPQSVLTQMPAQVSSDCTPMNVNPTPPQISSDPPSMLVDISDLASTWHHNLF